MEHYYKAYTKLINDTNFYFVKKYTTYPEFQDSPAVLEKFGMHKNFKKACMLAEVFDIALVEKLYDEANASMLSEQNAIEVENQHTTIMSQRLNFLKKINLIKKNFTSRITHWHLMPH